jgi:hypothetical protein
MNIEGDVRGANAGSDRRRPTGGLPVPVDPADRGDLLWQELNAQFRWYDRAATRSRYGYQGLRLVTLVVGAAVTVLAAVGAAPVLTASLAAVVVVAEGAQQLFQFHANWIGYRATAERLRQHGLLYAAGAAPYAGPGRRDALAEVVRDATSKENALWATAMRQTAAPPGGEA